jgi:large conductance mechanosensitive channel
MLKGFKEFLLRGNVVELAIAVVIGSAFAALVKAFTESFIEPTIKWALGGGVDGGTVGLDKDNRLAFGTFTNAIITFVITAAVVYFFFVVPFERLKKVRKKNEVSAPAVTPPDIVLLEEIRDLLADRSAGSGKHV